MPADEVAAVRRDRINVLQHLEPLEMVFVVEPHAFAHDLQNVHDPKRIIALVRAQLAVVGVVHGDQRVYLRLLGGVKLVLLQLAAIRRQRAEIVAHQPDRRLAEIDQLDPGDRAQDVFGRLDHTPDARVSMQGHTHLDSLPQVRSQAIELPTQEQHEWGHLEGTRTPGLLNGRQSGLGKLHVTARAPGDHLARLAARELVHGALGKAAGSGDVAAAHLHDAAAMGRAAHDLVGDAERVHDVECQQGNMRRLEHVAARVEDEVGRLRGLAVVVCLLTEPRQHRLVELQARDMGDVTRDLAEALDPLTALLRPLLLLAGHGQARHAQQEARIDAVVAGLDAFPAEQARVRPIARGLRPLAGAQDLDNAVDDAARRGVNSAGARDRAHFHAFAAAGARVRHRVHACRQRRFKGLGHLPTRS